MKNIAIITLISAFSLGLSAQTLENIPPKKIERTVYSVKPETVDMTAKDFNLLLKDVTIAITQVVDDLKPLDKKRLANDEEYLNEVLENSINKFFLKGNLASFEANLEMTEADLEKLEGGLEKLEEAMENIEVEGQIEVLMLQDTTKKKSDTSVIKIGNTKVIMVNGEVVNIVMSEGDKKDKHDHNDGHKTEVHVKKNDFKRVETDWFRMDFGLNTYLQDDQFALTPPNSQLEVNLAKSVDFSLHLLDLRLNLVKDYVAIETGIGWDFVNYHFRKNIKLEPNKDSLSIIQTGVNYDKNKLAATYITVPAMLVFNTGDVGDDKHFFLAGGMEFGFLTKGKTKQISAENGKQKIKDDFNLNPFKYGVVARVGYGNLGFFGRYSLNGLFAANQGPELTPVAFGISLGGF